ncbi:hypothetical protein CASFOL_023935 [Castilleja foliolosa]|uniref:Uncharacterized protein n=1 Tax=Castilleja foliolosa TaxID=1961234 RepID=A0ABD3CLY3_9LAMI
MSAELASLHDRTHNLSRISICKYDVNVASIETVTETNLPVQNDKNVSPNNENPDKVSPGDNNVIEINEQVLTGELLTVTENQLEESKYTSTDFSFGQEQTKPANNDVGPDDSQVIPGVEPLDMVQTDPLNEISEGNYQVNVDVSVDAVPDQTMHIPSTELEKDEIEDGLNIEKDGEKEIDVKDDILTDVLENNFETKIYNVTLEEQREVEFSDEALVSRMENGFTKNDENLIFSEAYQPNMADGETSGFNLHDPNEINYSTAGMIQFLNVDGDDLNEMDDDDHRPDDAEMRNTDNIRWSSRTRAVSKYLQGAFAKEEEEVEINHFPWTAF